MKKRLGLDTSSFRKLREKNYVYVDKTRWITKLINEGESYFISRPRRFGKSLTISTLKELFKGNKDLFKGLYIEEKWEFKKYPVLLFDFNEMDNSSPEELKNELLINLHEFFNVNDLSIPESKNLPFVFKNLILQLKDKYSENIVILIDEYDKPIIDHLGREEVKTAKLNRDILESIFGTLKGANVVDHIKFVFVTGVSRFSKVSIFSKWNNLKDITMHKDYASFMGYTNEEVESNFDEYLHELCKEKGYDTKNCLEQLRYYYNGYRFSEKNNEKVFNPISIMNCLNDKSFENYWFSTATPSFLVNLIKEKGYLVPDLENVELVSSMLEGFDIENLEIEPLLLQTGYLTIKDYDGTLFKLSYPNEEVKKSFNEILLKNISKSLGTITFAQ